MRIVLTYILPSVLSIGTIFSQEIRRSEFQSLGVDPANSHAAKTEGGVICPTSIPLQAKDSLVYATSGTTSIPSGSTVDCLTRSFYLFTNTSGGFIDSVKSCYSPSIQTRFDSYQTSLRTYGTLTFYEATTNIGCVGPACSFPIGGPTAPSAGTKWSLFAGNLDPTKSHTLVFSKTGAITTTTITIKSPWLNAALNTFVWNTGTANSYSVVIPANTAEIGTCSFVITPTVSAAAFVDYKYGVCKIRPRQMPVGTYTVTYTLRDTVCTAKTATYIFTVGQPNVNWTTPSVCVGSCPTLTASLSGSANSSGTWSGSGVSGNTFCGASAGTYSVVYTVGTGTCSNVQGHNISVYNYPSLSISSTGAFCPGNSATISAGGATSYNWSPATGLNTTSGPTVIASPTTSTTYSVAGTANGCSSFATAGITVYPKPLANFSFDPQPATITNSTINFTDMSSISSGSLSSWLWNFGDGNSAVTQNTANWYSTVGNFNASLIVTSNNGCSDTAYNTVIIGADYVNLSNSFSPNGDGLNDVFEIEYIEQFPKNHVYIYNRWGQLLWDGANYDNVNVVWDGKDNKKNILNPGTYFYILEIDSKKSAKHWVELTK